MPSKSTSTKNVNMGPWQPMQSQIMNTAVPAVQQGYNYATTGPGGQLLGTATGLASDTMGGKYLDLANNPYLMNAMDAASRASQTYYDMLGMRSGRGLRGADFAGAMARGTEAARLQPLLQLYEAERGRQMGALQLSPNLQMAGMAPSLAMADAYRGFGALGQQGTETTKTTSSNPMGTAMSIAGLALAPFTGGASLGLSGLGGGMATALGNMGMPGMPFSNMGGNITGWNALPGELPWK